MKNLVVGANSFIAARLIAGLKKSSEVWGVYHNSTDNLHADTSNIKISEIGTLKNDFDIVYLIAAYIPENMNSFSREKLFESNIALCADICSRFPDAKIVLVSSVSVYGPLEAVYNEHSETSGLNEYGVSKLWSEHIVKRHKKHAIVRLSSVYGPGMKTGTIIPVYIKQALEENHIKVWGKGSRMQNYIHVNDVVNYLTTAAANPENGIYLGTAPESISNLALAEMIAGITGCHYSFTGADNAASFYYDNKLTTAKLHIHNTISINKGIEDLILWQKKY